MNFYIHVFLLGACGSVVVEALCYKPEVRGFESRLGVYFLIYLILEGKGRPARTADNFTAICDPTI
jgi:hypothetical protein